MLKRLHYAMDELSRLEGVAELARMYNANFISFEYRYYGESMPAGLFDDVPAL